VNFEVRGEGRNAGEGDAGSMREGKKEIKNPKRGGRKK